MKTPRIITHKGRKFRVLKTVKTIQGAFTQSFKNKATWIVMGDNEYLIVVPA